MKKLKKWIKRHVREARIALLADKLREEAVLNPKEVIGTLRKLREVWGNEGFSADLCYLAEVFNACVKSQGPILELGTGLTTIACSVIRTDFYAIEQDAAWLEEIQRNTIRGNYLFAPLKSHDWVWYARSEEPWRQWPAIFDLVICDGPYIDKALFSKECYQRWRYGAVPELLSRGISFNTMLVDDADDPRAEKVLEDWKKLYSMEYEIRHTPTGSFAVVTHAP